MSESTIGIKIANGEYYPVLGEDYKGRKRLILTTVNDNQDSVQIDLYKGVGVSIENASFIGSLMIEDILPKMSGEPDIELILGVDEEGNLNATASDRQSGDMQSLSISLDTVSEPGSYDLPDFEFNEEPEDEFSQEDIFSDVNPPDYSSPGDEWDSPESGISAEEESRLTDNRPRERKVHPLLLAAFIIVGLAIIGLLIILLIRSFPGEDTPPLQAEAGQVQTEEEPSSPPAEAEKTVEIVVEESKPAASDSAASSTEVSSESNDKPAETTATAAETASAAAAGFWYEIKYGDTLWDLSNAFYRTPWLYGRIATANNIENPDLIYWGFQIYIPE